MYNIIESMDIDICKNKIAGFLKTYCNNNYEQFAAFDFMQLKNDDIYGCSNRTFDCDDSNLIKYIFVVLYSKIIPNLSFDTIGSDKIYRRDTINTFNTVFGKRLSKCHFAGIDKFSSDKEFLQKIENFYHLYHTLGNFLLLPNNKYCNKTINQYRGTNSWHDFFDLFLIELKKCLLKDDGKDDFLSNLILQNNEYFSKINYVEFIKINFLKEYDTDELLYSPHYYHWKFGDKSKDYSEQYIDFANKYIDEATKLINHRSKMMIEKLMSKS